MEVPKEGGDGNHHRVALLIAPKVVGYAHSLGKLLACHGLNEFKVVVLLAYADVLLNVVGSDGLGALGQSGEEFVKLVDDFGNVGTYMVGNHFEGLFLNGATLGALDVAGEPRGEFVVVGL